MVGMKDYSTKVKEAVVSLDLEAVPVILKEALEAGEGAPELLAFMSEGMVEVGRLFEEGEYFLADLVLAGETMKAGVSVLEPLLKEQEQDKKGTIILCTVEGDVHDIGKNLVATMLSSSGFEVIDLGVDVPAQKVADSVREHNARAVGLSVLLTTMTGAIGDVVDALNKENLREQVKIAIGGACTTPELVAETGVDALGRDAVEAVRIFSAWAAESK